MVYQPVADLDTGGLEGFGALLRWAHPVLGPVSPAAFIPLAEQSGAIEDIGRWVLKEACTAAVAWRSGPAPTDVTIAVNVSVEQLLSASLVADVADVLAATGLAPHALCLELTETALVHDTDRAASTLLRLHDLGVRLAVDDFGTGYSSIDHLRRFPIDVLKIDRSFISGIGPDTTAPMVTGLLQLARATGMTVVAEGIETEHQRHHLRAHGCQFAQGWLFAAAMERSAADQHVAEQTSTPAPTRLTTTGAAQIVGRSVVPSSAAGE